MNKSQFQESKSDFDLKKIINLYLGYWKWFLLSLIVCVTLSFFYLRYTAPEYMAEAKIMFDDDNGNSNPADAILRDMQKLSTGRLDKIIEDQIEVFKSRELMRGVVEKLELNKRFYLKGRFYDSQYFPIEKAPIKVNFIESDSVINKSRFSFNITIKSENTFLFSYVSKDTEEEIFSEHSFGKNVETPIGDIIVTPNIPKITDALNNIVYIKIYPVELVVNKYLGGVGVSPVAEGSKVVNVSLVDESKSKAKKIIDYLIEEYNTKSIEDKKLLSSNTADFINKRIDSISSELYAVDDEIERFKTGNKLTNITSEAELYLKSNAQTEQDLAVNRAELNKINYMKDQLSDDSFTRIPLNVGLSDGAINSIAKKYNELLDNRDRLLKSSGEKNPIVVNLDQQLGNLKENLMQSLNNTSKTIGIQVRSLENRSNKISSKIYAVPGQVRKSRDIQREQGIKESLYLFLLQKREEASISLIATSSNVKVIDHAHVDDIVVSPKANIVYLVALIFGLGLPIAVIYIINLLDTKLHNKEDLQKEISNITILGEIPNFGKKENGLVKKNDRSVMSESFRIIRTNFDYVRRGRKEKDYNNVIFVTSTINSEGKSFVSLNLALTLANTDKRVLLIGADIRNPQIFSAIKGKTDKSQNGVGLTEYLVDKSIILGEAINSYSLNDIAIDIMLSGKVPPNPAELLMSDRMKGLFDLASEQYDYVIVDTAPSMLVTDTLLISQYSGHTIFVTRAGYTEKRILNFARELHADKKLNGMMLVVNDVNQSNFGYGAKYGYYGETKRKGLFGRFRRARA